MQEGAFKVTPSKDERKIIIELISSSHESIPEDQIQLKMDVESTLTVMDMLFNLDRKEKKHKERDRNRFLEYFHPLVDIARDGLQGPHARPKVARRALSNLQNQITTREGGEVKHRYMKRLAKHAVSIGVTCFIIALLIFWIDQEFKNEILPPIKNGQLTCFFLLISGCTAGVWLSFGVRRPTLTFYELNRPEPDQLHPLSRVVFATLLTIIVSFLFTLGTINLEIGELHTSSIYNKPLLAWVVGAMCGFSEQLLTKQVSQQAGRLFQISDSST